MDDDRKTPYAPGCRAKGDHGRPALLDVVFPGISATPNMPQAIAALEAECRPCVDRHGRVITQHEPSVIHQAAWLWLGTVCVARHTAGLPPAKNGDDLVTGLFEKMADWCSVPKLSLPTLRLFRHLQLSEVEAPFDGPKFNTWDMDQVEKAVNEMSTEDRALAWGDLLFLLLGWLRGAQRAYASVNPEETNR
ncbi:hypothetical protein ACFPC0_11030 [Streptomyces andamanensis]|uniref:Uncharacterized protein n=1 Tax=Streptomyces andamanensis TaxID=1565035 RepID=A0ABV8TCI8_9ACTN